jgi:hypothetical protein
MLMLLRGVGCEPKRFSRLTLIRNMNIENLVESQWVDLIMDLVGGC